MNATDFTYDDAIETMRAMALSRKTMPETSTPVVIQFGRRALSFESEDAARHFEACEELTPGDCPRLPPAKVITPPMKPDTITGQRSEEQPQGDHEAAVIGCLLSPDNEKALEACLAAGLKPEDFAGFLGRVYGAIMDLHAKRQPIDLVSLPSKLTAETLTAAGGALGLNRLVDAAPVVNHTAHHATEIIETAKKIRLASLAARFAEQAKTSTMGALSLMATFRAALDAEDKRTSHETDLDGVSLAALAESEIDGESILLGRDGIRYLCKGGAMLFGGPSGIGKSSASAQQDILWSLGRPAFGITPARPLKIVTVQAENDQGDLIHIARGIMTALNLDAKDLATVDAGTVYLSHNASTGTDFLAVLDRVVRRHRPDLIRIDPLMSYAGGDLTKPDIIAEFCRCGLNRLATRHNIGIVVCHHTPKQTSATANKQAREQRGAYDWQYALSGGADLANWARAVMAIEPKIRDVFAFHAAKRWPGWKDENGEKQYVRYFTHDREEGKIFWHDATPEDVATVGAKSAGAQADRQDLETLIPDAVLLVTSKPLAAPIFKDKLHRLTGSDARSKELIALLVGDGHLEKLEHRGRGKHESWIGTAAQIKELRQRALKV